MVSDVPNRHVLADYLAPVGCGDVRGVRVECRVGECEGDILSGRAVEGRIPILPWGGDGDRPWSARRGGAWRDRRVDIGDPEERDSYTAGLGGRAVGDN